MPNTKVKICNVSMHYWPIKGGQEVYIDNLSTVLRKHDFDVSTLQRNTGSTAPGIFFTPTIPKDHILGKYIHNAAWFVFNIGLFFSKRFLRKQDILLCHYPFHYPPISWHKKVIIISHGTLWEIPPTTLFDRYHKKAALRAKQKNIVTVANDTHYLREIGFDIKPGQGFFTEVFKNTWLIPNCVDTNYFTKNESVKKEKLIIVPRNIRHDRGIHLAIEAFSLFAKQHTDYTMDIIGSGSGEYFDLCKKMVTDLGLQNNVRFVGHATKEELLAHYNRAEITLIPSLEKEGTSLSALESMSCGTATIVTAVGGLLDLPAIIVEPKAIAIAEELSLTLENLSTISLKQQKVVQETFNIDIWAKTWLDVINATQRSK